MILLRQTHELIFTISMPNSLPLFQEIIKIFLNRDVFSDDYPVTKRNILYKIKTTTGLRLASNGFYKYVVEWMRPSRQQPIRFVSGSMWYQSG